MMFVLRDMFMTDIITNSSSEVFVMSLDKQEDAIWELIQSWIDEYNEDNGGNLEYHDVCYIERINENNFKQIVGYLTDWDWRRIDESWDEYATRRDRHINDFWKMKKDYYDGKIAVWSTSDNTIPWDIVEKLEEISERRIHLG